MFWGGTLIWAGVVALSVYAACYRRERPRTASQVTFLLGGGILFPLVVLAGLLGWGAHTGHALVRPAGTDVLRVDVRAHQWWWEVSYPRADGDAVHTANEIHIPVGRPVEVHVTAADVVHSFWVPRLGGKIDALPGRINRIRLQADKPGVFRGQCAEFCGAQHARMALIVVAHDEAAFEERLAALAAARLVVHDETAARAFARECAECHSTSARQRGPAVGPNLADLPERRWLGAGTLPNGPAALRHWIRDHQSLKPGNLMPMHLHLTDETLEAIARYLEGSR